MDTKPQKKDIGGQNVNKNNLNQTTSLSKRKENFMTQTMNLQQHEKESSQKNLNKKMRNQTDCIKNSKRQIKLQKGKFKEIVKYIYDLSKSLGKKEVSILIKEEEQIKDIKAQIIQYLQKIMLQMRSLFLVNKKIQSYQASVILDKQKFINLQRRLEQLESENNQLVKKLNNCKKCFFLPTQIDEINQSCDFRGQIIKEPLSEETQIEIKNKSEQSSEQVLPLKDKFIARYDQIPQITVKLINHLQKIYNSFNQEWKRRQTSEEQFIQNLIVYLKQTQNISVSIALKQNIQQIYQVFVNYNKNQQKVQKILYFEYLQTVLCFQKLKELSKSSIVNRYTSEKSIQIEENLNLQKKRSKNKSTSRSFHQQNQSKKKEYFDCFLDRPNWC